MKIGLIDFYLCEYHAEHYPEWVSRYASESGQDVCVSAAWAELDANPFNGRTSRDWQSETGVPVLSSAQEVCENCDAICVLSPDNAEKHLSYLKMVLPYRKPVFVDKTFAVNAAEGREMFSLAEKAGVPLLSTSALRCASEIADCSGNAKSIVTLGGGASLQRYLVHQAEMIVKAMGTGAEGVVCLTEGENKSFSVRYANGRSAVLNYLPGAPFAISADLPSSQKYVQIDSDYFYLLTGKLCEFFRTGKSFVPASQTLEVMALIDACLLAEKAPHTFVPIGK